MAGLKAIKTSGHLLNDSRRQRHCLASVGHARLHFRLMPAKNISALDTGALFAPRRLKLPKEVVAIVARPELDSEGQEILGVWVILSDSSTPAQRHPRALAAIIARIRAEAEGRADVPPPHVRFRLKSEQDDLDRACA